MAITLNLDDYAIPTQHTLAEIEARRAATTSAAVELTNLVPFLGPAVSAVKAFADARAAELRYRQLEDWLVELRQRLGTVERTKLDREWLTTEEGLRVFLSLGEAACDLLREDKVRLLAGAEYASCIKDEWERDRKRFAAIIIGMELESLLIARLLAERFGAYGSSWNIHLSRYAEECQGVAKAILPTPHEIAPHGIADALDDLRRHRLADVIRQQTRGGDVGELMTVAPRPVWNRFAAYLREAIPKLQ